MTLLTKVLEKGINESLRIAWNRMILRPYFLIKYRNVPEYKNPTVNELMEIEGKFNKLGISINNLTISIQEFENFKKNYVFTDDYKEGKSMAILDEKILEHFIAYKFCRLNEFSKTDIYVDVAGANSPWAKILREKGYNAYAIDLIKSGKFRELDYYLVGDAKQTKFNESAVKACSLQCAYEMFIGNDDCLFINECKRILQKNGKVVIAPLYMHTHNCGYSTPEYYRKGYADIGAKEYIKKDLLGIPFSRKYSVELLRDRILNQINKLGMKYQIYKLINKDELGEDIYCHFILVITKN